MRAVFGIQYLSCFGLIEENLQLFSCIYPAFNLKISYSQRSLNPTHHSVNCCHPKTKRCFFDKHDTKKKQKYFVNSLHGYKLLNCCHPDLKQKEGKNMEKNKDEDQTYFEVCTIRFKISLILKVTTL